MRLEAFTRRTADIKLSQELSVPPPLWVAPGNLWEMYPRAVWRTVLVSGQETYSRLQEQHHILAAWEGWGLSAPKTRVCRTTKTKQSCHPLRAWHGRAGKECVPFWCSARVKRVRGPCQTSLPLHSKSQAPDALTLQVQKEGEGRREVPITSAPCCWQHRPGTWCLRTPKAAELPSACSRQKSQRASTGERSLWDRHRGNNINLNRKWN